MGSRKLENNLLDDVVGRDKISASQVVNLVKEQSKIGSDKSIQSLKVIPKLMEGDTLRKNSCEVRSKALIKKNLKIRKNSIRIEAKKITSPTNKSKFSKLDETADFSMLTVSTSFKARNCQDPLSAEPIISPLKIRLPNDSELYSSESDSASCSEG